MQSTVSLALHKPHGQERLLSSSDDEDDATSRSLSDECSSPLQLWGASSAAEHSEMLPSPTVEHRCGYTPINPAHQARQLSLQAGHGNLFRTTNPVEEAPDEKALGLFNPPHRSLAVQAFHAASSKLNLHPPELGSLRSNFTLNFCSDESQGGESNGFAHTAVA